MKSLRLPAAMIGLTALLTACPQTPTPTPPTAPARLGLTVNLTGVSSAPVKVTNTSTNTVLNDGPLSSGKTFGDLTAGTVLKVEPGNISDFTAPATQTITLDASKTIRLEYKALAGSVVQSNRIQGSVSGLPIGSAQALLATGQSIDIQNVGNVTGSTLEFPLTAAPDSRSMFTLVPSDNSCSFNGAKTSSPSVALFTEMLLSSTKGDALGYAVEQIVSGGTEPDTLVARLYSASAATVQGTILCSSSDGSSYQVKVDLTLKVGWNAVEYASTSSTLTLKSLSNNARATLKAFSYEPSVDVLLGQKVEIVSDASVSVPARLYQDGGYSGQVSLSTDVPGLTIEPSTVTLPALSAQSLSTQTVNRYLGQLGVPSQRLDTNLTFKYTGQTNYDGTFDVIVKDNAGKQVGGGTGILTIRRPGLTLSACAGNSLELYPSQTRDVQVCANSIGSFSGPVTYSATDLPAGVTVTPVTQTLNGYSYITLTFKSDATVKPGTYPITLIADGGSVKASSTFALRVPAPTVNVAIQNYYGTLPLYQGSTTTLQVNVSTQNGFNGITTLNVSGLPAGVSAAPRTVTVTPGSTTIASITLTASADAVLGNTEIKVTSPDQAASTSGAQTTLSVRPARQSLGTSLGTPVQATGGIWAVTSSTYDSTLSAYKQTVTRFTAAGQAAVSATLNAESSPRLISTSDGVVVVHGSGQAPTLVADDGTVTQLPAANLGSISTMTDKTDNQGRVWFVQTVSTGMGGIASSLKTWNPVSGVINTVDTTASYSYSSYGDQLFLSHDGRTLVYLGGYSSSSDNLKIDTTSGTLTKLDLLKGKGATSAAVAGDGTIWFSSYGTLARLNTDDTITSFDTIRVSVVTGFDLKDPTVLWGSDYGSVYRINTINKTAAQIAIGSMLRAILNDQGGVQIITSEYNSNGSTYYLSQLK